MVDMLKVREIHLWASGKTKCPEMQALRGPGGCWLPHETESALSVPGVTRMGQDRRCGSYIHPAPWSRLSCRVVNVRCHTFRALRKIKCSGLIFWT